MSETKNSQTITKFFESANEALFLTDIESKEIKSCAEILAAVLEKRLDNFKPELKNKLLKNINNALDSKATLDSNANKREVLADANIEKTASEYYNNLSEIVDVLKDLSKHVVNEDKRALVDRVIDAAQGVNSEHIKDLFTRKSDVPLTKVLTKSAASAVSDSQRGIGERSY